MTLDIPKYFTRKDFKVAGIYFLLNKGRIVYIGKTTDILYRLPEHANKIWDKIRIIQCDQSKRDHYEKRWIIKFRPRYNIQHLYNLNWKTGRRTEINKVLK